MPIEMFEFKSKKAADDFSAWIIGTGLPELETLQTRDNNRFIIAVKWD